MVNTTTKYLDLGQICTQPRDRPSLLLRFAVGIEMNDVGRRRGEIKHVEREEPRSLWTNIYGLLLFVLPSGNVQRECRTTEKKIHQTENEHLLMAR